MFVFLFFAESTPGHSFTTELDFQLLIYSDELRPFDQIMYGSIGLSKSDSKTKGFDRTRDIFFALLID